MTTSGKLSPGFAGAVVDVKYTRPNGTSFVRSVTTASDGTWSDTITPGNTTTLNLGNWTIRASYAGDDGHLASSAAVCTTTVDD